MAGEITSDHPSFCMVSKRSPVNFALARHIVTLDVNNVVRYYFPVIKGFADRDTERLFNRERVRCYPAALQRPMLRKLVAVDAAEALEDLRVPPGNRLEKLKGDRAGQHSIRVNDQWRICFRWADGNAHDVELVDYH